MLIQRFFKFFLITVGNSYTNLGVTLDFFYDSVVG
jgi:hypothetical protein